MTAEEEIKSLKTLNNNLLFILGAATSFVYEYKKLNAFDDEDRRCDWILKAIEEVVYRGNSLPEITW